MTRKEERPDLAPDPAPQGEVPPHLAIMAALMGDMAESGLDFRATLTRIEFIGSNDV